jgi:aspartate 1-decarboxylase
MRRSMLKSKIHRATVTETNLEYEGSMTIDAELLDAADMVPFEEIHVWDVTNGTRLTTYAMAGSPGSGVCCVNGAGAHLIKKGDLVIIATFFVLTDKKARKHRPTVILLDKKNRPKAAGEEAAPLPPEEAKPKKGRKKAKADAPAPG